VNNLGGGKKKQSLSQMTKPKKTKEQKRKEKAEAPAQEKKTLGLTIPDLENKKILAELKGMKVLTPSSVATRFNIRVSTAKTLIKELEKRKIVEYVSGGKNLKIYKVTA